MLNMWIPKDRIPIQVLLYSFRAVLNMWIPKDQNILAVCKNKKTSNKTPAVNKNVKYVWIPKSGTKYHYKKSCGGMRNPSKVKISVAKKKGYTACKKCVK